MNLCQVPPHRLRQKWCERSDELAGRDEALVQRPISVELVGRLFVGSPKPIAAPADVPVRKPIDEFIDPFASFEVVVKDVKGLSRGYVYRLPK